MRTSPPSRLTSRKADRWPTLPPPGRCETPGIPIEPLHTEPSGRAQATLTFTHGPLTVTSLDRITACGGKSSGPGTSADASSGSARAAAVAINASKRVERRRRFTDVGTDPDARLTGKALAAALGTTPGASGPGSAVGGSFPAESISVVMQPPGELPAREWLAVSVNYGDRCADS